MGKNLGELEQLLLMALVRRGGEASGIDLREELLRRTGRAVLPGAVYTVMERLGARGFVAAQTADATPARGGRRRKLYRLTTEGERTLADAYNRVERMADGIADRLRAPLEDA